MKCGPKPLGFTLVETMIFLAVSGALLITAMAFITSTQSVTQFNQGANDALQQINTVIGNVSDGYYPNMKNFSCAAGPGGPVISAGTTEQGKNKGCVFLGRVIDFQPEVSGQQKKFVIHDVAGLQQYIAPDGAIKDVDTMEKAKPTLLSSVIADNAQEIFYRNGLRLGSLEYESGGTVDAAGFFSSLAKTVDAGINAGLADTSAQQFDFVGFNFATITGGGTFAGNYDDLVDDTRAGLKLCLTDGSRQAEILIGGNNRSANTSMTIGGGDCTTP